MTATEMMELETPELNPNELGMVEYSKKCKTYRCESCGRFQETILNDSSVGVANSVRTETTVNRYCSKCQNEFLESLKSL